MPKREEIRCSFCGKPQNMVEKIITGSGVYICDECVKLCMSIIDPEEEPDFPDFPEDKDGEFFKVLMIFRNRRRSKLNLMNMLSVRKKQRSHLPYRCTTTIKE